jgi:hypothetical protein
LGKTRPDDSIVAVGGLKVGSFGIIHEAQVLAYSIGRQLNIEEQPALDLDKSAGPATVVLTTLDREKLDKLTLVTRKPVNIVGKIL